MITDPRRTTRAPRLMAMAVLPFLITPAIGQAPARSEFTSMGTFAAVSVPQRESARLGSFSALCKRTLNELEQDLSTYRPDSEVTAIANMAGISPTPISDRTEELLRRAAHYYKLSDGAFDITVIPLLKAWGLRGAPRASVPSEDTIRQALDLVGADQLVVSNSFAYLPRRGMCVDLGGIAKGYAVDVCYDRLMTKHAKNVLVDLGGNIRCTGRPRKTGDWLIGVQHPFVPGKLVGTIGLSDGLATATSGNYERFVEIDGKRYAHIIDPRTGRPVEGMASVTVVCTSAMDADAMSTTLYVLGTTRGMQLLKKMDGCEALFIPDKKPIELWATPAFKKRFKPSPAYAQRVFTLR